MFEGEELTDEVRAALPGESVQLSAGKVYYHLDGPEDNELVVLIHGMSVPSFIWDPTWASLVDDGFQVLRYDLYGRGYSDRPNVKHNLTLYVNQLFELLQALELANYQLNIIGFSLGAGIGAAFAAEYPHLVRSITLIEPVHPADMPARPPKLWQWMIRLRRMAVNVDQSIVNALANNFYRYENFPDFEERFRAQLAYKGFARAMIATMLDFDYEALPPLYQELAQKEIPCCLLWGAEDQLSEMQTSAEFIKLIPAVQFHTLPQAGHLAHYERPDLANPLLIDFLNDN